MVEVEPPSLLAPLRLGLVLAALLACTEAAAQAVVARVNGAAITLEAIDRGFERELRARNLNITRMQRPEQVREIKREVLGALIREELLWQRAQREGMVVSDEDVGHAVAETAGRFKTREAFERQIAREGFDERGYREHARRLLSADRAAQALVDGKLAVTDNEVEQFYRANPQLFRLDERLPETVVPLEQARSHIRQYLGERRGREILDREVAALRAASQVEVLLPF